MFEGIELIDKQENITKAIKTYNENIFKSQWKDSLTQDLLLPARLHNIWEGYRKEVLSLTHYMIKESTTVTYSKIKK